ncbi:molybdopterin molybdotransferase MoeA [Emticicia sp. BO119]|uniref:molybdopterin molybdotransferase MoeA n=1 Tax=Emticicia sp. BO119 TaxID=2757768 RepID=UPI0015F11AD5|nr:molybdopterin molybdotransferase MoeA [Emticicia sp. BO119]MBA4850236.1 molybdopterin molybdotransferase MoeA [Emticicia sp. BO119]
MITVRQAEEIILTYKIRLTSEKVNIEDALGRMLAEDLQADRDFPPFDRVSMDGIAIAYEQIEKGQTEFPIEQTVAAGKPQATLENPKHCIEIMTGAMLPVGTDTVIRYEDISIKNKVATIEVIPAKTGLNIHKKGIDRKQNDIIVTKGAKISPAEIGIAATIGKNEILVQRQIKAIVISTGEEIVPITSTPLLHQIRTSNSYALQACLKNWGITADTVLLPDSQEIIEQKISEYLETYDVLILSGGVSAGKFDFVPKALESQGVRKLFHKVSQRPGKPFWFGVKEQKVVFALPGNPVSTFMCLHRYFKLWLDASQGLNTTRISAELGKDFVVKFELTFFLQVKLEKTETGTWKAIPIEGNGSGDLASLVETDAFIELPMEKERFKIGEKYDVWLYR